MLSSAKAGTLKPRCSPFRCEKTGRSGSSLVSAGSFSGAAAMAEQLRANCTHRAASAVEPAAVQARTAAQSAVFGKADSKSVGAHPARTGSLFRSYSRPAKAACKVSVFKEPSPLHCIRKITKNETMDASSFCGYVRFLCGSERRKVRIKIF